MKNTIIIVLIIICIALYASNPTRDDFKNYTEEKMRREIDSEEGYLSNFLAGAAASIASKIASTSVSRQDYYLFSTYSLNLSDSEVKFIGIANNFIALPNNSTNVTTNETALD